MHNTDHFCTIVKLKNHESKTYKLNILNQCLHLELSRNEMLWFVLGGSDAITVSIHQEFTMHQPVHT